MPKRKIAAMFTSAVFLFPATPALAGEPMEGELFWWETGVILTIQSHLMACNELYPVFVRQNNFAYFNSVFANPVYDSLLQQYPQTVSDDPHINQLMALVLRGKTAYKTTSPEVQHRLCSEFPHKLEESTQVVFGLSSTAIKRRFAEMRKRPADPVRSSN